MRVVIGEDNALLREGLVLLLTSAGHEVVAVAASGPEVLPALLAHRPDAAVLDVRMPPPSVTRGCARRWRRGGRYPVCRFWCCRSTWRRPTPWSCWAVAPAGSAIC